MHITFLDKIQLLFLTWNQQLSPVASLFLLLKKCYCDIFHFKRKMAESAPEIVYGAPSVSRLSAEELGHLFEILHKHGVRVLDTASLYVWHLRNWLVRNHCLTCSSREVR